MALSRIRVAILLRALIDAETGQVTDRYDHDAWGNVVHNGSTRQPFIWNGAYGYEWVPETGLYHVGAREYDPRTARWLQRDPAGTAGGHPNLYVYPRDDPINWFDVDGLQYSRKLLCCKEGWRCGITPAEEYTYKWLLATDQVRQALQLTRVPDHTTRYRTFAKLSQQQWQQQGRRAAAAPASERNDRRCGHHRRSQRHGE